jgi:hypothetical protein
VQRATAQSITENFRDCGVAKAPPDFQAGWSDCMYFFFTAKMIWYLLRRDWCFTVFKPAGINAWTYFPSLSCSIPNLKFPSDFCTHEVAVPYRSSAQMSFWNEGGVSFVALGPVESQLARHWLRSAAWSRHLTHSLGRSVRRSSFLRVAYKSSRITNNHQIVDGCGGVEVSPLFKASVHYDTMSRFPHPREGTTGGLR